MNENNKKIAKNTVYLYVRQLIMMVLGFVTTRIVLDKLGASDYGVNNLVAGFVGGFAVLNNILSSGTRRFLALNIGKGDQKELRDTFATSLIIHVVVAIIVVVAIETFGLWFLNSKLNIAPSRMYAANWIFQLAVIGIFVGIVNTPFGAAVTAHEKFNVYATMSIFDVVAKLVVLYLLVYLPGDKLIIYALLNLSVSLIGAGIYLVYCLRKFPECSFSIRLNKSMAKDMLKFSGWGAFGHLIITINRQGVSILTNLFFSTVMNAARGLAMTAYSVIANFITGFLQAGQPQLVKYYGQGKQQEFNNLIFNITQYTLFIVAIIAVPCFFEIDYVIGLWLGDEVPDYTCAFVKIVVALSIISNSNCMVENGLHAINRIKENSMYSVPIYLLDLPLVYIGLKLTHNPIVAQLLSYIPCLLSFVVNIYLLSKYIDFPGRRFFVQVFLKNCFLIIVSSIIPFIIHVSMEQSLLRFLIVGSVSVICTTITIWIYAMNDVTKNMIKEMISRKLKKFSIYNVTE